MRALTTLLLLATALSACGVRYTIPAADAATPAGNATACNAAALQGFVGQPKEKLPANLPKASTRLMCSTCTGTMDYNPGRLNIIYDTDTGRVTKISCG